MFLFEKRASIFSFKKNDNSNNNRNTNNNKNNTNNNNSDSNNNTNNTNNNKNKNQGGQTLVVGPTSSLRRLKIGERSQDPTVASSLWWHEGDEPPQPEAQPLSVAIGCGNGARSYPPYTPWMAHRR